jgi:hypothetical protein
MGIQYVTSTTVFPRICDQCLLNTTIQSTVKLNRPNSPGEHAAEAFNIVHNSHITTVTYVTFAH